MSQPPTAAGGRTRFLLAHAVVAIVLATIALHFQLAGSAQTASPIQTVFVIVFENHNWSEIVGNSAAPYINSLLPQASRAEQYYTPPGEHPSTPNYWWMEAGQDFGLAGQSNYTPGQYPLTTSNHLVNQLEAAGVSWKTYHEDIDGTTCPLADVNKYTVHHNQFVFFTDVTNNLDANAPRCIAHVRPFTELATDLGQNTTARYNFIVPNLCNDMHDCSIASGDSWLAANLPVILNSQAYLNGGAVFITWDEGTSATSDGPLGMIVLSPAAKGNGYSNSVHYTHSSLLLTLQELFRVQPLLGDAANATDLSDLFAAFPAVTPSTPTPADKSSGIATSVTLKWSSSGGNDDVYLGTTNPPPLVASGIATRTYSASLLQAKTYYWQVVSRTSAGTTAGPVWSFTTGTTGLPSPWTDVDIGAVGLAGSASYATGTFTVRGAGADIWGSADAFHYVYEPLAGDGQVVARVTSLQNTNAYAKAGLMIRQTLDAASAHVILDIKPGGGVEFMQRAVPGGSTTFLKGTTMAFPAWLRLAQSAGIITASVSNDGNTWTTLGSTTTSMGAATYVGLPVTSHTTTALTAATFDNVVVTPAAGPPPSAATSPSPADGATGVSTTATLTWTAAGATSYDVAFGSANPPSPAASGLSTAAYTPPGMSASTQYYWQVTAHNSNGDATGPVWTFTTAAAPPPPPPSSGLPSPWLNQDIGAVGTPGSATYSNGVFTVQGAGSNIWGTADSFQFVYQPWTGDGQIVARMVRMQNTSKTAKAGVMLRETLTAGSRETILDVKPAGGLEFMVRTSTGGSTKSVAGGTQAPPAWVKLVRQGTTVTAYASADGATWVKVGSATITMASNIYVGLAVCSRNTSVLNTAVFDGVIVGR